MKKHGEKDAAQTAQRSPGPEAEARPGETGAPGAGADTDKAAPPAENPDAVAAELTRQLEEARNMVVQVQDQFLRARAEAENIRRRAENDVANARKYGVERFASEMLAVRDSLEQAGAVDLNEDDAGAVAKMREGLELTVRQMDGVFERFGLEAVAPQPGEKFDPERHQAMTMQATDEVAPNHVVTVVRKGYMLQDRLLRPAMVIVAKAADAPGQAGSS
jgi:molecular chaperone GrpE